MSVIKPFSFIHAADLHLDSPFKGVCLESEEIAEKLRDATFSAFGNLVDLCISKKVDFLLLSGDIFDLEERSLRALLAFRDGLARLDQYNVKVFVVHGNHDPLSGSQLPVSWPGNVTLFSHEAVQEKEVSKDGVPVAAVHGISYRQKKERRNLARLFKRTESSLFHIGLLHCNVGSNTGHEPYSPCELSDFLDKGFHYWALGHVHGRAVLHEGPLVVYPGNTQARHINERGDKGCYFVQVDGSFNVDMEFCPIDVVRMDEIAVDIRGLDTMDLLENAIISGIESRAGDVQERGFVVRVGLGGRGPIHRELRRPGVIPDLVTRIRDIFSQNSPFVWVEDIEVRTRPEVDVSVRRKAPDFLGELLGISHEIKDRGDFHQVEEALLPLFSHYKLSKIVETLTEEELKRLVEDAELICLDLLEDD